MKNLTKVERKLLNNVEKASNDYNMIEKGDRILVCLSGGKDSFAMLKVLRLIQRKLNNKIELLSFTLDQSQPGWDDAELRQWLENEGVPFEILTRDTYSVVTDKIPEGKTYCSLCSRLRRGIIYRYARENGFNKVALGHHRDDLIRTLLMSMFYAGTIKSMPPKLLTDDKQLLVIRPLVYCQENDIIQYRDEQKFPIIPCNLCGSQENLKRVAMRKLIDKLALDNPKVPSNILHALQSVKPSQLMDKTLWDFVGLDEQLEEIANS